MQQRIHSQEKEQFIKLFKQDSVDRFEDRFTILTVFLQTEQHLTSRELHAAVRDAGHDLDAELVHGTLELMCRYGFAQKSRFDNGEVRYEHLHLGQHHDHMICTKCRRILEFSDEELERIQMQVAAAQGFHLLQHRMELYGICDNCLKQRHREMPLISAKAGESLRVTGFSGGAQARMRLLTMGLRVGDRVDVINNQHEGQLVIALDFKRLVLGRGLASKIMVEALTTQ
jgi:Fur family ferric uptake transcriptional regulator